MLRLLSRRAVSRPLSLLRYQRFSTATPPNDDPSNADAESTTFTPPPLMQQAQPRKGLTMEEARNDARNLPASEITGYGEHEVGVNGVRMMGSVMVLPNFCLLWKPKTWEDVTVESLAIVPLLRPKIGTIILGTGAHQELVKPEIKEFFELNDISVVAMNSVSAMGTFAIMNEDDRDVAAAILSIPINAINFDDRLEN